MRKKIILALSIGISISAKALETSEILKNVKQCQQQWQNLLPISLNWLADTSQSKQVVHKGFDESAKAWRLVGLKKDGVLVMQSESTHSAQIQQMDSNCQLQAVPVRRERFSADQIPESVVHRSKAFKDFDDLYLEKLIKAKKSTIVYVWSPWMVYSPEFHNQYQKMARKLGYEFVSVVDFRVSKDEIEGMRRKFAITKLPFVFKSNDLFHRGALLHFPTTFLVGQGRISRQGLVGIVDEKMFQKVFRSPAGKVQ